MMDKKTNVVMGKLYIFTLELARMKALEIINNAKNIKEYDEDDIKLIVQSANEFLENCKNLPFTSNKTELNYYKGIHLHEI